MLILTRRVGETIYLSLSREDLMKVLESEAKGLEVTVTVLGVKGNQVRLGTNAPKSVSVDREEIFQRKQQEMADDAKRKLHNREGHSGNSGQPKGVARDVRLG